jgi:aryl-alcohol dehydrogenase-like predicted oxidoreductase
MRPKMRPEMRHVPLPSTGLQITRMVFGGARRRPVRAGQRGRCAGTLEAAWACGVRAFDTAPHCGAGLSEQRPGESLGEKPRDQLVISTKVGRRLGGSFRALAELRRRPQPGRDDAGRRFLAARVPDGLWADLAAGGLLPADRVAG